MPKKTLLLIVAVLGIAYYAYGHFMPHGSSAGGGAMSPPPSVGVAEVIARGVRPWHEFSGRLAAVDRVEIRPRVSGVIDSVHFKNGALVNKGDLLFVIDPRPFQAVLQAAVARADYADSEYRRARSLMKDKAMPQHDFDQKRNDAEVAQAELATARL